MGDPRKHKKKFETPLHPWIGPRIKKEAEIVKSFGLKNKKEVWKFETRLRNFKGQAKKLIAREDKQAEKEEKQLKESLSKLGLISNDSKMEDILGLDVNHLMERRLQTVIQKLGFAKTVKQARQFITHGHIFIGGKKMTSPSYVVSKQEESTIKFSPISKLNKPDHPERIVAEKIIKAGQESLSKKDLKPEEIAVLEKAPKVEALPEEETVRVEAK